MQKHGYRFWILRLRKKVATAAPRAFDYLDYVALTALVWWAFFYGVDDFGIINGNESLYVESAREMALSGDWAVPTLNGLPYLEKPPLFIWLITAAASLSTSIELPPRLVTSGASLVLALGIIYFSVLLKIGRKGFAAAFIFVTSLGVDVMSRVAMPDFTLTTLFSLGCLSFLAAVQTNSPSRFRWAAGVLGAASLIKGALPLMLFGLIVLAYYSLEPTRRSDIRRLVRDPFAALLMFMPLCLWLIAIEVRLPGAASHVIVNEHILRFLGMREPHDYYSGSSLYYVHRLFLFFFPWAGVLFFGWLGKSRDVSSDKQ
jgi:4-amino-4-deoxy-L-arabinose transferase-like glycosyltransferase